MKVEDVAKGLSEVNTMLETLNPLLATAIGLGLMFAKALKQSGTDIKDFQSEIDRYDGLVADGIAADDQWRADHGLPPMEDPGT